MENAPIGYVEVSLRTLLENSYRVMAWVEQMEDRKQKELEAIQIEAAAKPWWHRWFLADSDWYISSRLFWKYRTYEHENAARECLLLAARVDTPKVLISIETANLLFDTDKQVTI